MSAQLVLSGELYHWYLYVPSPPEGVLAANVPTVAPQLTDCDDGETVTLLASAGTTVTFMLVVLLQLSWTRTVLVVRVETLLKVTEIAAGPVHPCVTKGVTVLEELAFTGADIRQLLLIVP
jgi:hypothetical protein